MSYRFLRSPRWLLLHVLFAAIVFGMINAGLWQLRRMDFKRDLIAELDERTVLPAEPIEDLVTADADPAQLEWRPATAVGEYRPSDEVLVRGRTLEGAAGAWVLTPLVLPDGRAVLVNRGFVGGGGDVSLPAGAGAPPGRVEVEGLLVTGQTKGRFGPTDPPDGKLDTLARADIGRVAAQVDYPLLPLLVQLRSGDPAPTSPPYLLPDPDRSEGPHLGYALQWFLFTAVALVGYPLLIRRSAKQRSNPPPDKPLEPSPSAARASV